MDYLHLKIVVDLAEMSSRVLIFCSWVGYVSGRDSQFIVKFSVEVDDGFLVTSLPAELINTTELKLMSSYQWQPLQTYVAISKHFMVKANGVRFRGTLNDCNSVMQQLSYHVSKRPLC